MGDCERIQDTMIDYINRRLDGGDCRKTALHLSQCKRCREEISFLIKVKEEQKAQMSGIASDLFHSAFQKLPDSSSKQGIGNAFSFIRGSLRIVEQTLRFAEQFH